MSSAEKIVAALLDGKVRDWLSDKWNDIKVSTGIGHDSFGMGKPSKGFKPRYGTKDGARLQKSDMRVQGRSPKSGDTWDIS
jgi:hypothetical protein